MHEKRKRMINRREKEEEVVDGVCKNKCYKNENLNGNEEIDRVSWGEIMSER